jgi:hypothetical protein
MKLLFLLGVLTWAVPSYAEDKLTLDIPTAIWASAVAADYTTTYRNMNYFTEKNPVLGWLDHEPAKMIALGVAIDAGTYFLWRDITKNNPKVRKIGLITAAVFRGYLAVHNQRAYAKVNGRFQKRLGR